MDIRPCIGRDVIFKSVTEYLIQRATCKKPIPCQGKKDFVKISISTMSMIVKYISYRINLEVEQKCLILDLEGSNFGNGSCIDEQ